MTRKVQDYIRIIVGTTLLGIAINVFMDKLGLVPGGVSGLAIIIKALTQNVIGDGIPIWLTNLVVNIPLLMVGFWLKGKNFGYKTVFASLYLSVALYYTSFIPKLTDDMLLACLFGGSFAGVGLGLVIRSSATTGGTDLAATILKYFNPHISVGKLMLYIDSFIIICGLLVFGPEKAMYGVVTVMVLTKVIDYILEGLNFAKGVLIISDQYEQIANKLLYDLERGVTGIYGKGMYTNNDKQLLFCVASKNEIPMLKQLVKDIDNDAFISVTDVNEVLGEGFGEMSRKPKEKHSRYSKK